MKQNETGWWNTKRVRAAQLVAEGQLTDEQIAADIKIGRATLHRWKLEPIFQARISQITEQMAEAIRKKGIRLRENRLAKLDAITTKLEQVFEERAKRALEVSEDAESPGLVTELKTGLVLIQHKRYGTEYVVDTPALREYREYMKQAAIEVGEWTEKQEITGADSGPLTVQILDSIAKVYGKDEADQSA